MTLTPTYKIENGPSAVSVEQYSSAAESKFLQLLDSEPPERDILRFLEQNPALVPGARTPGWPSGHPPLNNALITQPELPGLSSKFPDFMWIASHSLTWYPTLVEIERPDKMIFKSGEVPRAEFTQAYNQLAQWRSWFTEPENVLTLIREYGIPDDIVRNRSMKLHMILVYGRRSEFEGDRAKSKQRSALVTGADEELVSYDRLRVDKDLRDVITVRCTGSGTYRAVAIPSTFTLGPTFADRLVRIAELDAAIQNADISLDRRAFLIRRLEYWRDWAVQSQPSIINSRDRE